MPTLNSTTLSVALPAAPGVGVSFSRVMLASIAGVNKGDVLAIDGEGMTVIDATANPVKVMRGNLGRLTAHAFGSTVYFGKPYQFKSVDPAGVPPADADTPWINFTDGNVWVAQGDEVGPGVANRYWQKQVIGPRTAGALGILQRPPSTP